MERPEYDGTYCATAFWTKKVGFQIEYWKQQNDLLNIPKGAARICYKDSIYENGWAQIEIETQRSFPDWVQAYGAGIIEGSLTWKQVYHQWLNTIQSSCEHDEEAKNFCAWLRELLTDNYVKIKENAILKQESDHYWHQISLYFNQLEGLETGYRQGAKRARSDLEEEIPFSDFLLMNSAADIQDLRVYYENYVIGSANRVEVDQIKGSFVVNKNFNLPSATMLTKIFQATDSPTGQLLFGHSTAGSYASMLRIQKRYKFHFHFGPNQRSNTVPGVDITFTGYPGILASTDDFYVVKGRQVQSIVAGVAIKNENLGLWQTVNVNEAIPLAARVMAANRIAQNRKTWAKAMSRHPFTGSKQWITVDLNKLGPLDNLYRALEVDGKEDDKPVPLNPNDEAAITERLNRFKGLVWIAEQLPGRLHMKDVTDYFLKDNATVWLANGTPYFDEILEASKVQSDSLYAVNVTPSEKEELTNLESVDTFLRTHGFRGDLLDEETSVAYGNIDIKLFAYNARLGVSDYHAFAGPVFMRLQHTQTRSPPEEPVQSDGTINSAILDDRLSVSVDDAAELAELEIITDRRPVRNDMKAFALRQSSVGPFKWSSAQNIADIEHAGHPDEWNFGKVSPKWAW